MSNANNLWEPAAPTVEDRRYGPRYGLTKQEYFACEAMKAMLSNPVLTTNMSEGKMEDIKNVSIKLAQSILTGV